MSAAVMDGVEGTLRVVRVRPGSAAAGSLQLGDRVRRTNGEFTPPLLMLVETAAGTARFVTGKVVSAEPPLTHFVVGCWAVDEKITVFRAAR